MGSPHPVTLRRTLFSVPKMDCPSEERLIRMALDGAEIGELRFDLAAREVAVVHGGDASALLARLVPLGLGAAVLQSEAAAASAGAVDSDAREAGTLRAVLAINAAMFAVELVSGWLAQSMGLVADSLDMLADAAVYALALYAVGKPAALKVRAAHVSGWLQAALALGALGDVVRRLAAGSAPEAPAMMGISLLALAANVSSLLLVSRHRDGGAHMKASVIFSTNDVLANLGVILAGALVAITGSRLPDLAVGAAVAAMVLVGGIRILRLR
ncbi:cation transporter [Anaeromyxobacter sp. SG64]|uniref:cation transporter n=1 Tax=Anaeromyxobacter sp. SG64 TaxID=2925409 RepID=UPI001F589E5E|nr:cation transporter [Anaeromyxobacter sp. SG64]